LLKPTFIRIFCIFGVLLSTVAGVRADELFVLNLLQHGKRVPESEHTLVDAIKSLDSQIEKEPARKWQFLFKIASLKARQGKLSEALNDLSCIINDYPEVALDNVFAERAEVKSLLGFTTAALEDCDRTSGSSLHFWHRWLILNRAGRYVEANRALQAAIRAAQHEVLPNVYSVPLHRDAEQYNVAAIPADPAIGAKVIAMIEELASRSTPPSIEELKKRFGVELQGSGKYDSKTSYSCYSCTGDTFWDYARAASDLNQILFRINTDVCSVSKAELTEHYELEPDTGMNGNRYFAKKKGNLQALSFGFEGDKEPKLRHIALYWKEAQEKGQTGKQDEIAQ